MKKLKDVIIETLITEAAPKFEKSIDGIKAFCDYVYDKELYNWTINSDLSITIDMNKPRPNGVNNCYMDPKDLTEIPDFITYSNIPAITLGITGAKKLTKWTPNVNGTCAGVIVSETCKKIEELDLTNCDCKGSKLYIHKTPIRKIIVGNGD